MISAFEIMHLYITEQSNYQPHCQRSTWNSEKSDEVCFPSLKLPANSSALSKCLWLLFNLFMTNRSKWDCAVKWNFQEISSFHEWSALWKSKKSPE